VVTRRRFDELSDLRAETPAIVAGATARRGSDDVGIVELDLVEHGVVLCDSDLDQGVHQRPSSQTAHWRPASIQRIVPVA
jgi:hypothetical protein